MLTIIDIMSGMMTVSDLVEFIPDEGRFFFLPTHTGWSGMQECHTERHFLWYNTGQFLVPLAETYFQLWLKRVSDYTETLKAMNAYCRECYSNEALGLKAQAMTREEWYALPPILKKGNFWLADISSNQEIFCVKNGKLEKFGSDDATIPGSYYNLGVRPVIYW